jgi:transcriptional regulator with XRE-family HTH domain
MSKRRRTHIQQRVRLYLTEHGMTQDRLAADIGITAGHLSSILSRKETPSLRVAVALEGLTGIPARKFVGVQR